MSTVLNLWCLKHWVLVSQLGYCEFLKKDCFTQLVTLPHWRLPLVFVFDSLFNGDTRSENCCKSEVSACSRHVDGRWSNSHRDRLKQAVSGCKPLLSSVFYHHHVAVKEFGRSLARYGASLVQKSPKLLLLFLNQYGL